MHAGRGWADTLQARKPASSGGYQPAIAPDKSKGEGGRAQMDPGELLRHPVATLLSSDAEKSNRVLHVCAQFARASDRCALAY